MQSNLQLSPELRRKVDDELQTEEVIQWIEQPIPRLFAADSTGYFLLGLFFIIISISLLMLGIKPGIGDVLAHVVSILVPVLLALIGFGLLSSPLWAWQAARQRVYLVTDKRAISIQGGWFAAIKSYLPDQLNDLYRKERADGTGDVIIAKVVTHVKKNDRWETTVTEKGFFGVRNPKEAERRLRQLERAK